MAKVTEWYLDIEHIWNEYNVLELNREFVCKLFPFAKSTKQVNNVRPKTKQIKRG